MSALTKIKEAGFSVTLEGDNFKIIPFSKLTETQREFLKSHKSEIINELKAEALRIRETFISCGKCLLFKCHNQHGQGAGICNAGVMPGGASHWGETPHQCEIFNAKIEYHELPEPKPGALIVVCYSPAGKAIQVEATSREHAQWLVKTNPKREAAT